MEDLTKMKDFDKWSNKTISPKRDYIPKVNIHYPCPGLFRCAFMVCSMAIGITTYYLGFKTLGLEPLDWLHPAWTSKHIGVIIASIVFSLVAGLIGAANAMKVEVRSERLSDFYIIVWQFIANTMFTWIFAIGIVLSITYGKEEAKEVVFQVGAEKATFLLFGSSIIVGLVTGILFFISELKKLPFTFYLFFSVTTSLLMVKLQLGIFGIHGIAIWIVGILIPFVILLFAPAMITRDRQQRKIAVEDSN